MAVHGDERTSPIHPPNVRFRSALTPLRSAHAIRSLARIDKSSGCGSAKSFPASIHDCGRRAQVIPHVLRRPCIPARAPPSER